MVFTGIVANTTGTLCGNDFLENVVVEAFLSVFIVKIYAEIVCAVDRYCFDRCTVGDRKGGICCKQVKGKALICNSIPVAGKILVTVKCYLSRCCLIGVCKIQSIVAPGRGDDQNTVFVRDCNRDSVEATVICKATLAVVDFLYVILIDLFSIAFAQICRGIGDGGEGEGSVCLVGNGFDQLGKCAVSI